MANREDSEKDAKISDSAYSNCSNSPSQRSSRSTHSGSNCSGSSGYGGKKSTTNSKIAPTTSRKGMERNRKTVIKQPALLACRPPEPIPLNEVKNIKKEELKGINTTPSMAFPEMSVDNIGIPMCSQTYEIPIAANPILEVVKPESCERAGFSCVISMQDGVVIDTTKSLSQNLGFPHEMWIGRSFIEFVHPGDRATFSAQITNSLAVPKNADSDVSQQQKQLTTDFQEYKMACRIRRYRNLSGGFAVKNRAVPYVPFVLNISFKQIKDDEYNMVYLIVKGTPLYPAYKSSNEILVNPTPFVIRHSATGALEYMDIESVQYLGYFPQDVLNQDTLLMYHPDDLPVLKTTYETIVKESGKAVVKSMPYRVMAQNGDYVKLQTEWTSFIDPWSMKLGFVTGKHIVLEGPTTPDVFKAPPPPPHAKIRDDDTDKINDANLNEENDLMLLKKVLMKPAEFAKQQVTKHAQDIASMIETLLNEPKAAEELIIDTQEGDNERDSVILGVISPHHESNDSTPSTPLSYNQLNFNENMQRYFDSHIDCGYEAISPPPLDAGDSADVLIDQELMAKDAAPTIVRLSPMAQNTTDSRDISCPSSINESGSSTESAPSDLQPARLSESLLIKHNNDMEKELANIHREGRSTNNTNRASDNRQKTKEHLARCNASFHPAEAGDVGEAIPPYSTLKRLSKNTENEIPEKQPCLCKATNNPAPPQPLPSTSNAGNPPPIYYPKMVDPVNSQLEKPTSVANEHIAQNLGYPEFSELNYQTPYSNPPLIYHPKMVDPFSSQLEKPTSVANEHFAQNLGYPQISQLHYQTSYNFPLPIYYPQTEKPTSVANEQFAQNLSYPQISQLDYQPTYRPWMYPRPYGYTGYMHPSMSLSMEQKDQGMLAPSNEAPASLLNPTDNEPPSPMKVTEKAAPSSSFKFTEPEPLPLPAPEPQPVPEPEPPKPVADKVNSDEDLYKTDEESSYSSFYSVFLKTESGGSNRSSDPKKPRLEHPNQEVGPDYTNTLMPMGTIKGLRRKTAAPLDQVKGTPSFRYKYTVPINTKEYTLEDNMGKITQLDQSHLVDGQLRQLYQDLHLESPTSSRTLEEGITSFAGSRKRKLSRPNSQDRKRKDTDNNMSCEENDPLPCPYVSEALRDFASPSGDSNQHL